MTLISKVNEKKSAAIRNSEIGIVLQEFALMEQYTVLENVIMPLFFTPKSGRRSEKEKRALEILKRLEMDEYAHKKVNKLSGGQKQRVAIARAMINNPSVLLADEPTGNLDPTNSWEIMKLLEEANDRGTTVLVVTHNQEIVNEMQKRVVTMKKGVIVSDEKKGGYKHEN